MIISYIYLYIFYLKRINKSGLTRYTTEVNYLSIIIVYLCCFFLKNPAVDNKEASRLFEVVEKDKFDQEIPVEWEAWLRERPKVPLTEDVCIDKIRKNNAIQQNAIRKAKELEELEDQDAAKRPMNIEPKRESEKILGEKTSKPSLLVASPGYSIAALCFSAAVVLMGPLVIYLSFFLLLFIAPLSLLSFVINSYQLCGQFWLVEYAWIGTPELVSLDRYARITCDKGKTFGARETSALCVNVAINTLLSPLSESSYRCKCDNITLFLNMLFEEILSRCVIPRSPRRNYSRDMSPINGIHLRTVFKEPRGLGGMHVRSKNRTKRICEPTFEWDFCDGINWVLALGKVLAWVVSDYGLFVKLYKSLEWIAS
uniref:Uncharacterized protein n=1 Tax=Strigamia maritima TaxID=126957 RepID=T1ILX4_STRMM